MPAGSRYRGPSERDAKKAIAAWIDAYLARTKIKAVDLAHDIGVSEGTISNIRSGKLQPGFKVLVRLHFGIGAHLEEVLRARTSTHGSAQERRDTPQPKDAVRK